MQITPDQIRAARALLRLTPAQLAERAHTTQLTLLALEAQEGAVPSESLALVDGVRTALEGAGVEFIEGGVRKRPVRADAPERYDLLMAISRASAARLKGREDLLADRDLYDENGLPV